jgi:3-deoxy-D-manno-octulosonic acid (KDO) 8-phosphate synthase
MRSVVSRIAVLFLVVLVACGSSASQRASTISAALVTVDAARDGFVAYDAAHQAQIVDAATSGSGARAELATYRQARDAATGPTGLLTTAYRAIAAAATVSDAPSLTTMQSAIAQLLTAIKPYLGK